MENAGFMPEVKEFLDAMLLKIPGVRAGKMFGYPAYYVNKNLFEGESGHCRASCNPG